MDTGAAALPDPCLVVLVGPAGSGKSTWAATWFRPEAIVSSDALRALVGAAQHDLAASADAFELLDDVVERRLRRRLTTVIDTLGTDADRRARWRARAEVAGMACVAVEFDTPADVCRQRNRSRVRPVPAVVLTQQLKAWPAVKQALRDEGFTSVLQPAATRLVPPAFAATTHLVTRQQEAPVALRFGLQLSGFAWSGGPPALGPHLRRIGIEAEEAGFESIWVMDHLRQVPSLGPEWADLPESWATLAHLAAVTNQVRLGTMVSAVTLRHPVHLGKVVATLDVLSGGRAVCGIGLGNNEAEHRAAGIPFPPVAERYRLVEDTLELLPLLWGRGSPAFHGRVLDVPEALGYPRPLQAKVPILLGGSGHQTLRLAARLADAANLFGEPGAVTERVAVLRAHCAAVGRDPAEVEVTHLSSAFVGAPGDLAARGPRPMAARRFASLVRAGAAEDHIGRFRALADAGVETAVVSLADVAEPGALERFSPVIRSFR